MSERTNGILAEVNPFDPALTSKPILFSVGNVTVTGRAAPWSLQKGALIWIKSPDGDGAILMGAITPHDSRLAQAFARKLEDVVTVLLLPAFFASVGMRTQIGLVSGLEHWLICGLIIAVATAGKFGGTYAAARVTGLDRRNAAGLGVLMNTRGLMELIVLNIGLEMKVISPTLFAMMVIMALATTIATGPALWLLRIHRPALAPSS